MFSRKKCLSGYENHQKKRKIEKQTKSKKRSMNLKKGSIDFK